MQIIVGLEEKKMPFNLFRKKKQPEQEIPAVTPQEEPKQETPPAPSESQQEPNAIVQEKTEEPAVITQEPSMATTEETTASVQEEAVAAPTEQKQDIVSTSGTKNRSRYCPKQNLPKSHASTRIIGP